MCFLLIWLPQYVHLSSTPAARADSARTQVLRQTSFTEKMVKLGWTEQGFFDTSDGSDILQRCIARYQG